MPGWKNHRKDKPWTKSGLWKATQALKILKGLDGKPTGVQK